MFLAINELIKEKLRFILIIAVIALVSYLTFFLTALAYGLATSYTQGIEKWSASGIVLQKDANDNVARSLLTQADYREVLGDDTALLGVGNATIEVDANKEDVAIFGIEQGSFLNPNITEGRGVERADEVVVSDELQRIGVVLGQTLVFKGGESTYNVVGFTDRATFQTAPIVYMQIESWRIAASELAGMRGMKDDTTVSAIVTIGTVDAGRFATDTMQWQTITDFSFKLPGYNAQVLTFSTMIGFLIVIASFVLAIFMYILTLQKKSMFGVLKAEGVPNKYIARSVKTQIVILSVVGMAIGLAFTLITGIALADKVPFMVQPFFFIAIVALFLLCAAIGGIASVWAVTKIDPVEAIG
ncbi:ABC transporter permease [Candidatus Saccharibacteria bacterium]|nr:ABC transporter permease [Candidatus Saccharibacteria bacterium]